jgi:hypothetical protein
MNDTSAPPMVINPSPLPAMGGVIVRYASALLAGWLIRRGVITDSDAALVEGLALAIATVFYALWRAYKVKAETVKLGREVPDHIAIVTEPSPPPSV